MVENPRIEEATRVLEEARKRSAQNAIQGLCTSCKWRDFGINWHDLTKVLVCSNPVVKAMEITLDSKGDKELAVRCTEQRKESDSRWPCLCGPEALLHEPFPLTKWERFKGWITRVCHSGG